MLELPDEPPVRVVALQWHGVLHRDTTTVESGVGIGGLVAELALASASGEVLGILSNRAIEHFKFGPDGTVVDQTTYAPGG
jgi:hypothetical protein